MTVVWYWSAPRNMHGIGGDTGNDCSLGLVGTSLSIDIKSQ